MSAGTRVLFVEDDEVLRDAVTVLLETQEYVVGAAGDARSGYELASWFRPDLAVLDIGLPGELDGFALARKLRSATDIPILYLTASSKEADTLTAFEIGADDYVVKPFSSAELLARMRAVLRRSGRLVSPTVEVRDIVLDETTEQAWRGGVPLELTTLEFRLLDRLARSPGEVISKVRLLSDVWGYDQFSPNLVEVHVSTLRKKLERLGPRLIYTVRGEGYALRP